MTVQHDTPTLRHPCAACGSTWLAKQLRGEGKPREDGHGNSWPAYLVCLECGREGGESHYAAEAVQLWNLSNPEHAPEQPPCEFFEDIPPYGRLYCRTIFSWYDGPLIYMLENHDHRLFVYSYDMTDDGPVYWYLPISQQTQADLSAQKLCLLTLLTTHTGEAITHASYHPDNLVLSRQPLPADKAGYALPKAGVFLEIHSETGIS